MCLDSVVRWLDVVESTCYCVVLFFVVFCFFFMFFFQAEDGIRDLVRSRGLGDVYKRQTKWFSQRTQGVELTTLFLVSCDDSCQAYRKY